MTQHKGKCGIHMQIFQGHVLVHGSQSAVVKAQALKLAASSKLGSTAVVSANLVYDLRRSDHHRVTSNDSIQVEYRMQCFQRAYLPRIACEPFERHSQAF